MFTQLTYTVLMVLCFLLAVVTFGGLVFVLKKYIVEDKIGGYKHRNDWYRIVVPAALALLFAFVYNDVGANAFYQWIYIIAIAITLPILVTYYLNRNAMEEKKRERISILVALLLLLNASIYTGMWCNHYKFAHAIDGNNANQNEDNPHLSKRNWFLIPLWIVTVIVGSVSGLMWKKHHDNQKETDTTGNNFLPF